MRSLLLGGLAGELAIKPDEVGGDGLGAELAQQRGYLPAMIGAVIGEVLQRLP